MNLHLNFIFEKLLNSLYQNFFQAFELTKADILKFFNKKTDLA